LAANGQTNPPPASQPPPRDFAGRARAAFERAQSGYSAQPADPEAAWHFARAGFDYAEFATNSAERAELAELGIAACRKFLTTESNSAPLHYYLAMNLGQLARTKSLGALKLVDEMEREFTVARDLQANFDLAGPDRNLGLLYRDAPAIGSVGSRSKARKHILRAVELAPGYPENRLSLIEAYVKWNEKSAARKELKAQEKAWDEARTNFSGDEWGASWVDWERRLKVLKKKLEKE
jgi:hypothetical protein